MLLKANDVESAKAEALQLMDRRQALMSVDDSPHKAVSNSDGVESEEIEVEDE